MVALKRTCLILTACSASVIKAPSTCDPMAYGAVEQPVPAAIPVCSWECLTPVLSALVYFTAHVCHVKSTETLWSGFSGSVLCPGLRSLACFLLQLSSFSCAIFVLLQNSVLKAGKLQGPATQKLSGSMIKANMQLLWWLFIFKCFPPLLYFWVHINKAFLFIHFNCDVYFQGRYLIIFL